MFIHSNKPLKRCLILIALLTVALLLLPLYSCKKDPPPSPDGGGTVEPGSMLDADGKFRYTIVYGASADAKISETATLMQTTFGAILTQESITLTTDATAEVEYEILIGETGRPESAQVKGKLGKDQFAVRLLDGGRKLVIVGCDDNHTVMAVEYFMRTYAGYDAVLEVISVKDNIKLPADLSVTKTQIYSPPYADTPTIVGTRYTTEDVVVADIIVGKENYDVDPTGKKNSAPGIQKALNDCEARGGGTVFLPAGNYRITKGLQIPSYVVLRGDWQDPDYGNEYGTVIYADVPMIDISTVGTFSLGAAGGAYGLTIYYPDQKLDAVEAYPYAFYFNPNHQNKGNMAPTVKNCTVINGYRGVGVTAKSEAGHEQLTIENLRGTFLETGIAIGYSSDVGTCTNITIAPNYWSDFAAARGLEPVDVEAVRAYTRKHTTGMKLSDVEWTEYIHITITDCKTGIKINPAVRIGFAGSFYDTIVLNCDTALLAEELDKRWGMQISNSYFSGSNYAIVNESEGMIKTAGTTMLGGLKGSIAVDEDSLADYKIDIGVSYKKPNAILYVADFDKTGKTDISSKLQALLDEAGKTGGIVYLPGGDYLLDQPVNVPAGVELRGTASTANREQNGYGIGTRILTHYGLRLSDTDRALITLGEYAGINGIRIAYTSNDSSIRDTAYAIRGTGKGVYVTNSCIIAAGRGVDFAGCDDHFIKKLTSFCYINDVRVGGKNGTITGFLHNCTVRWRIGFKPEATENPGATALPGYQDGNYVARDYNTSIIIVDAEGQRIWNAFSYGVATFIEAKNSKDTLAVNFGTDNIGDTTAQMVIRGGDFTGINILRYNGHSYDVHDGAEVTLYSRLAINDKSEDTLKIK